ncbi:MAG: A/G-specific adenine glycosylase, partial [Proteobacteria bacterium]|nr:A/G-specific adenine glycosylase [Pseudomonadota bacterium]
GFTHFHLEITVMAGQTAEVDGIDGVWCRIDRLGDWALPTVMKKIVKHALARGP